MAIEQKVRSLHAGLSYRIQFQDIDGRIILPLKSVPFELEEIVAAWMMALPERFHADAFYFENGALYALTQLGWDAFVSWMTGRLDAARCSPDFGQLVAESAEKSFH